MNIFKKIKTSDRIRKLLLYLNPYLYVFYYKNLRFPLRIVKTTKRLFPLIDPYIIFRKPKLKFNSRQLVIDKLYTEGEEVRENPDPYNAFYKTLDETFELKEVSSLLDVGCATGLLISKVKLENPEIIVNGLEYFEFHKKFAPNNIAEQIINIDIRNERIEDKYDLVVCTEVAEHIEPSGLIGFLSNLQSSCKKYLVMTWSSTYPGYDGPPQHVSSVEYQTYISLVNEFGFKVNDKLTKDFLKNSKNHEKFTYWWRDSLVVFEKQ